jgi:hypothetical protein
MTLEYRTYIKNNVQEAADIALKNRLYVSGWRLSYSLRDIREKENNDTYKISLAYKNDKPIGVCVKTFCNHVQVFVRKEERRQKIGTTLVQKTLGKRRKNFYYERGVSYSIDFFEKVKNLIKNNNI